MKKQSFIREAKEECRKMWFSSSEAVKKVGLPELGDLGIASRNVKNSDNVQKDYEEKEALVLA